jgi:hypothetical protein
VNNPGPAVSPKIYGDRDILDWAAPWDELVAESHRQGIVASRSVHVDRGAVVTVEWVDRSDVDGPNVE